MKVVANLEICQGHARCAEICPEVFTTDDRLGKVIVRVEQVPPEVQEQARLAVHNCPEGALRLSRGPL
jgi:ferredoxin